MSKFTYLLGAGASYHAFPIVSGFENALIEYLDFFQKEVESTINSRGLGLSQDDQIHFLRILERIENDARFIFNEYKDFSTIDKKAKSFYLDKNPAQLGQIKCIVDFYFQAAQYITPSKEAIDSRYEIFLNEILKLDEFDKPYLPDNLSILTWNYDLQFELATAKHFKEEFLGRVHSTLNIMPKISNQQLKNQKFKLIKLNGTAGMLINKNRSARVMLRNLRKKYRELDIQERFFLIANLLHNYNTLSASANPSINPRVVNGINYGWEESQVANESREIAARIAAETEYLVIIGYSFPPFNRHIDAGILSKMDNLKKVYIQDLPNYIERIEDRFNALCGRKVRIIKDTNLNEFLIPDEYL